MVQDRGIMSVIENVLFCSLGVLLQRMVLLAVTKVGKYNLPMNLFISITGSKSFPRAKT